MGAVMLAIAFFVVSAYIVVGALIFRILEADFEIKRQQDLMDKLGLFLGRLSC